ncbi:unnamed protein product [Durusdinium trenchii]|uniref:Uncharacterized protein n=1 Tax=Durusdinium trenchii TaxID=1381693 RepID=A0ABP0QI57_9DINO
MATHLVVFLTLLYGCLGSEARSDVAGRVSCDKASAQIHVATFASEINVAMLPFLASTLFHLGRVVLLDDGQGSSWPPWKKLPAYREYLWKRLGPSQICDFVFFLVVKDVFLQRQNWLLQLLPSTH